MNIPFNYSLYATLWGKIKNRGVPLKTKAMAFAVLLAGAPGMLAVGLPVLLYIRLKSRPSEQMHGPA